MERNGQKYAYESTPRRVPGKRTLSRQGVPRKGRSGDRQDRSEGAEAPPPVEYAKLYGSVSVLDHAE